MTEYGLRQMYYHGKRRSCPGYYSAPHKNLTWEGASLTIDEAVERAKELYPDLTLKPVTARKWTERGLLPSPTIESLGGTGGTRAHYPEDTPAQMAVAAYMMALRYTQKEIAQARQIVLEGMPVDSDLMRGVVSLLTLREEISKEGTVIRSPSPEAQRLASAVQQYSQAIALARVEEPINLLWPTYTHSKSDYHEGEETFSFYVSLLGLYWDPRVDQKRLDPLAIDLDQRMKEKLELIRWKRKHDN